MEVLVFENGNHVNVAALRRDIPTLTIHATPDLAEACRVGANAEVLWPLRIKSATNSSRR